MEFYYSKSIERPDPTHAGPQRVGIVRDYDYVEVFPDEDKTRPFELWGLLRGKPVLVAQCVSREEMEQTLYVEHGTFGFYGVCWIDIRTPVKWLGSTTRRDDAWMWLLGDKTWAIAV